MSQMEKERSALRDKMNDKEKKLSDIKKNTAKANHKAPKKLRIGDSVLVLSLNLKELSTLCQTPRVICMCRWVYCARWLILMTSCS